MTHGISGYVLKCRCTVCELATLRYKQARNRRLYESGRCRHCTKARVGRFVLCGDCLEKARVYQRDRNARLGRQTQEAA